MIRASYHAKWLLLVLLIGCIRLTPSAQSLRSVTAAELRSMITAGQELVIVDVRTEEEYNGPEGHLEGAILIPVQEIEKRIGELEAYKDRNIVVYCASGFRSRRAGQFLMSRGFDVLDLEGGIRAWNALRNDTKN